MQMLRISLLLESHGEKAGRGAAHIQSPRRPPAQESSDTGGFSPGATQDPGDGVYSAWVTPPFGHSLLTFSSALGSPCLSCNASSSQAKGS